MENLMRKAAWTACGALVMTLWPLPLRADYQRGVEDYRRGDYAAAYQEFLSAAEQGSGSAAHALGLMYLSGKGVARDNAQAVEWYRKAAELGFGEAPPPPAGGQ
jgi:TPR repeat protein